MKRRELLKCLGMGVGAVALDATTSVVSAAERKVKKRKRVLRIAHITDVHIPAEGDAAQRFVQCLKQIKTHEVDFFSQWRRFNNGS